eukprot:m.30693 g.30693  ORF g.30693 m.30693 type:complete len:758 (+) comp16331_c0_seq1:119-2392(+)
MSKWGMKIGGQVIIKRSDGRQHTAFVSGFNEATESVTVEWHENQETKGKELDLNNLAQLNPFILDALAPLTEAAMASPPPATSSPVRRATKNTKPSAKKETADKPTVPSTSTASRKLPKKASVVVGEKENSKSVPTAAPDRTKSKDKAVKKIQDIAAKREERRAKQVGQVKKNEKDKASRADNPNWEFSRMVTDYQKTRQIYKGVPPGKSPTEKKINVCVRKRPLNRKELQRFDVDVTTIPDGENVLVHECKSKVDLTKFLENHQFRFDHAFDESVDNKTVYTYTAGPLVKTIFDRGMATCFAYGQTGSGKTFTMGGIFAEGSKTPDTSAGIYAMAATDVFRLNQLPANKAKNLKVSVSYFEIYGGKVFDLLNEQKRLRVLEDGKGQVNVVGLAERVVTGINDVLALLKSGTEMRVTGTTTANPNSSRSHAVFQIILRNSVSRKVHGKFSLIDLAGNERGADTMSANRQTRMEGAEINKSLLALKECIRALSLNRKHTPYRASKLTQVLRDSFIGEKSRTCMIAMVSPGLASCENTLNTLRYADRVKELKKDKGGVSAVAPDDAELLPFDDHAADDDVDDHEEEEEAEVRRDQRASPVHQQYDHRRPGDMQTSPMLEANDDDADWLAEPTPLETSLARQDLKTLHESLKIKDKKRNESLYNFQVAHALVQEAEERVEEEHRAYVHYEREMLDEEDKMLQYINRPDNDVEDYAKRLDEILSTKIEKLSTLKDHVANFRKQLQLEETASRQVEDSDFGL